MRKEFEMTKEELDGLCAACRPVPYMIIGGIAPRSQQENANNYWEALSDKYGFDHMTVEPVSGKGNAFFTAELKAAPAKGTASTDGQQAQGVH